MSGSFAINGYGMDPYFAQYWQQYMASQAGQTGQLTFKGNSEQAELATVPQTQYASEPEKSHSAAGAVLTGVALVGAALLCRKAYKAGSGEGLKKIGDGFGKMWEGISGKANKILKPEKFTVTQAGGNTVCTIPGRSNVVRTVDAAELSKLGLSTDAPEITKEALASGKMKLENFSLQQGNKKIKVVKGKLVEWVEGTENRMSTYKAPVEQVDIDAKKAIDELIAKVQKGEGLDQLTDIKYKHFDEGVSRLFTKADYYAPAEFKAAITKRFGVESDAIKALRSKDESLDEALKTFSKGKFDGWKTHKADYVVPGIGTFKIVDGEISGIKIGSTFYKKGSDKYQALYYDNKKVFDKVLEQKKDFTNAVYQLA